MNIIYITGEKTWGSSSQYMLDMAEAMAQKSHKVLAATSSNQRIRGRFASKGIDTLPIVGGLSFNMLSMFRLSRVLKKSGPVIVHVCSINDASIASRAKEMSGNAGVRLVASLIDSAQSHTSSGLAEEVLKKFDAIIVDNDTRRTSTDTAPIHRMPVSVPQCEYPAPARLPEIPVIVFHGRITPDKRLECLLEAVASNSDLDFKLRIIGEGVASHVMPLKQTARRLGIEDRIEWTGYSDDARRLLSDASVGIYPDSRASSFAIKECIAQGIPVVTDYDGTLAESLRHALIGNDTPHGASSDTVYIQPYGNFIRDMESLYSDLL